MKDFFEILLKSLNNENNSILILTNDVIKYNANHSFDIFEFEVSDETKYLYNNYKKFQVSWEHKKDKLHGFINFVSYDDMLKEHQELCEIVENVEEDLIEDQEMVINDIKNWYPIFKFPNGDSFCYDIRSGKIYFYEHEVFDTGINLNGLIIADSLDVLLENWSRILFADIYDWSEGVNEHGIDLNKHIFGKILQLK